MSSVDRRSFLRNAVSTAAGGLVVATHLNAQYAVKPPPAQPTPPHTPPRRIGSGGINTVLLSTAVTSHVVAVANTYAGSVRATDWGSMSKASAAVATNIQQAGFDSSMRALAAQVDPSQLNPAYIDRAAVVQAVQVYQPGFTEGHLDNLLKDVPTDPTSMTKALGTLRQNGLSPTIQEAANRYWKMENYIGTGGVIYSSLFAGAAKAAIVAGPDAGGKSPNPQEPPRHEGGGGGYTCGDDAAASLAAATVFGVLAVMAAPELAGVLAGGALLNVFLGYGSTAVGVWGLGHAVVCGF